MASQKFSSSARRSSPSALADWNTKRALQETDHKTLFKRIEVAEAAILARRDVLVQSPDGFAERREIKTALDKLRRLKKEVLKFP